MASRIKIEFFGRKRVMGNSIEERSNVKFRFLLGKSAAEIFDLPVFVYGHAALSKTRVLVYTFQTWGNVLQDYPRPREQTRILREDHR
jgi:hypothetical protein